MVVPYVKQKQTNDKEEVEKCKLGGRSFYQHHRGESSLFVSCNFQFHVFMFFGFFCSQQFFFFNCLLSVSISILCHSPLVVFCWGFDQSLRVKRYDISAISMGVKTTMATHVTIEMMLNFFAFFENPAAFLVSSVVSACRSKDKMIKRIKG